MLSIYNTFTQRKEIFKPRVENQIGLYVCGITVYDYCHIGHARVFVAFDVVARYLRSQGYQLTYVRNITDIDDKIIKRALERNETIHELTTTYIAAMNNDMHALNVLPADKEPRATESIDDIIEMVQTLMDKGFAYQAKNQDIYFQVDKYEKYGQLGKQNLDLLKAGARVEQEEDKRSPFDFVLWKKSKSGEPCWNSPWGEGRPGWHIECSAMSTKCLGNHFDIHGGGSDLKFPHHENERAQSECATGQTFVNTWMHVGFVNVDSEKMSKSLGNFFTIRDVLKEYDAETIRYFLTASHYRSPVNYSQEQMDSARQALKRFYTSIRGIKPGTAVENSEFEQRFNEAMDDDFNTPEAIAVLFDLAKHINRTWLKSEGEASNFVALLIKLGGILGILQSDPELFLQGDLSSSAGEDALTVIQIEKLIEERNLARKEKNWAMSDKIRDELSMKGIILEDGSEGTTWTRV